MFDNLKNNLAWQQGKINQMLSALLYLFLLTDELAWIKIENWNWLSKLTIPEIQIRYLSQIYQTCWFYYCETLSDYQDSVSSVFSTVF